MTYKELFAQETEKRTAISALLAQDTVEMEAVKSLMAEADTIHERAEAMKANAEAQEALKAPQMPVELPTGDDTPEPPGNPVNEAMKSIYLMRFGSEDAAIKAILTDLHGTDYEQKRWSQMQGFAYYLRTGKGESKEFLWTPESVKTAIREGCDVKAMKATMIESSDTLGGYVVPEDWRADIISRMSGMTVVRPIANRIQTSLEVVPLPEMTGGTSQYRDAVRVTWIDEIPTAGTADTNLTLGQQKLTVYTVQAETFLSRNLVEDAAFNLVEWLTQSFAEAQAIDEDNKFLISNGLGSPQGILLDSQTRSSTTIGTDNSGSNSTLTFDGVKSVPWTIDAQYRQNARWVAAKATYEIIDKLKDGEGNYLWKDRGNQGTAGAPQRLLGYPVLEQEGMPAATTQNNYSMIFGDFKGYTIADRVGMSVERYLDSATARTNTVLYYARRRLGGKCTHPWKFVVLKTST